MIAILLADLHFQDKPPIARSIEPDWFKAMKRPITELKLLQKDLNNPPIVVAGDVTTHWKSSPELISFILENMPDFFAVPGNHDLPYHSYDEIKRSTYWTLVRAGKIHNIEPGNPIRSHLSDLTLYGFPSGYDLKPPKKEGSTFRIELAVVHSYIWKSGCSFQGAPNEQRVSGYLRSLKGYDAVVFGDNHKGFLLRKNDVSIFNAGTFMRRHTDEYDYKPCAGLLHQDGRITRYYFDCSKDKMLKVVFKEKSNINLEEFLEEVLSLGKGSLDFAFAVRKAIQKVKMDKLAKKFVLKAIEEQE